MPAIPVVRSPLPLVRHLTDEDGSPAPAPTHPTSRTGAAPAPTCAAVIDEITKSRALVAAAACDEHTKKVLSMQLQQLEQVSTVVQKGEDCVVDGELAGGKGMRGEVGALG